MCTDWCHLLGRDGIGVICSAGIRSECNVVDHYTYCNFLLFLRLNGSVNGLKPRIYYITLHFKFDDVTNWSTNNYNTHMAQCLTN